MGISIDDIALGVADALTGGMVSMARGYPPGTLAAVATAEALAQTRKQAAAGSSAGGTSGSGNADPTTSGAGATCDPAPSPQTATTGNACCFPPYQIEGQFLLETMSGRVWRYSDADAAFLPVPRRLSDFERGVVERQLDASQGAIGRQQEQVMANFDKAAQSYQDLLNATRLY